MIKRAPPEHNSARPKLEEKQLWCRTPGLRNMAWVALEMFLLDEVAADGDNTDEALRQLALLYIETKRPGKAIPCIEKMADRTDDPEKKAICHLAMGSLMQNMPHYTSAAKFYIEAYSPEPGKRRNQPESPALTLSKRCTLAWRKVRGVIERFKRRQRVDQ